MATPWARYTGRQKLARMMHGDNMVVGTPSSDNLSTTTFSVSKLSAYSDDYFNDWHGRFFLGPKADTVFTVTDFDQLVEPGLTDGKLTLKPTQTSAMTVQDQFEIYPDYTSEELNDAINLALTMVEEVALQDKRDESLVAVSTQHEYDVPAGFKTVWQIIRESGTSGRYSNSLDKIDPAYWRILPGAPPKIWFDSNYIELTSNRRLRLIGQQAPAQLNKDSDLCSVDQSYVVYQAKANLHFTRIEQMDDDHYKKMQVAQGMADRERESIMVAPVGEKVSY
jgi:hypothetical protein